MTSRKTAAKETSVDAAKSLPPLHGVPIQLEKTQSRYALVVMSEKKELKT